MTNPIEAFNRFWERYRQRHERLSWADTTYDQSHTWHALFSSIAGAVGWLAGGWWLGVDAFAWGVLAMITAYLLHELYWRVAEIVRRRRILPAGLKWWDGMLDVLKPLWAPGILALAILFGAVPAWLVALYVALTAAIAYAYSFGRPSYGPGY